jgi:N-acetylglutamate synthase-like GNAT family acetyltransferase
MELSYRIREALHSDFNQLNELIVSLGYPIDETQLQHRKIIFDSIILNKFQAIFVLESLIDYEVKAMISYSVQPQLRLSGFKMEIDELVVSPHSRGMGMGALLINFIMPIAKELGVKKIVVSCNRERESYKRKFYLRHGFVEKNSAFYQMDIKKDCFIK